MSLNWKQGLLCLYFVLWGVGAVMTLISSIYFSFFFYNNINLSYMGLWVILAVIAPAAGLKLVVWTVEGFVKNGHVTSKVIQDPCALWEWNVEGDCPLAVKA